MLAALVAESAEVEQSTNTDLAVRTHWEVLEWSDTAAKDMATFLMMKDNARSGTADKIMLYQNFERVAIGLNLVLSVSSLCLLPRYTLSSSFLGRHFRRQRNFESEISQVSGRVHKVNVFY